LDKQEIKRKVNSLKREYNINENEIIQVLRELSSDLNTLRYTKNEIHSMNTKDKILIKENVSAVIQYRSNKSEYSFMYITTFFVAIGLNSFSIILGDGIQAFYMLIVLSLIALAMINNRVNEYNNLNDINLYKLIHFIENLDII
jgi:predicted RNA-binding protein with EMAP domain